MKKNYTIAGIGVCLGKQSGCEALAESIITGTPVSGKILADSFSLAVQEALQYTSKKNLCTLTDTMVEDYHMSKWNLGQQKICGSFREMLETAPENAVLLSHRENGWMAIVLTQEENGFARVEITEGEETAVEPCPQCDSPPPNHSYDSSS